MTENSFKVIDNDTMAEWNQVLFPILSTDTYNLQSTNTYYFMSVGVFTYDTTMLQ